MRISRLGKEALKKARNFALENNHPYVGTEHLLYGLLAIEGCFANLVLKEFGLIEEKLQEVVFAYIREKNLKSTVTDEIKNSPRLDEAIYRAEEIAIKSNENVGTEHLLLAIIEDVDCTAARILTSLNISLANIYLEITDMESYGEERSAVKVLDDGSVEGGILQDFSVDLTKRASENKLGTVIGREEEIERMIQVLCRKTKNNPCLVGESGVGKTAVVNALANRISRGEVPEFLADKKIISLDLTSVVAGTKYRGEFEERMKKILKEVEQDENIILFLDEIHNLIGAGNSGGTMDAANIIKPPLSRGDFRLIGATTISEYRKYIEKDQALERRLQPINIQEPSEEETLTILKGIRKEYEKFHNVSITLEALKACISLSVRYINDRKLPDKAIDLLDETCSRGKISIYEKMSDDKYSDIKTLYNERDKALKEGSIEKARDINKILDAASDDSKLKINRIKINKEDVEKVVSKMTDIPVDSISTSENERLLSLEKEIHKNIIGQEDAIISLANAIRRNRVGIGDRTKPIGSFLFLGPTGVGKTEVSKVLARTMFLRDDALIRVDMSEYMESFNTSKLIGSPPGYVGYEEGGGLTDKVRSNPYSVILFDEIEKAHPDVFNILLQILDDGRLTDNKGRVVDFKNTIIIMTSNIGASSIIENKTLGFAFPQSDETNHKDMEKNVKDELKKVFKPEFINRIDDIIVFKALTDKEMEKIISLLLNKLKANIKKEKKISVKFDKSIIKYIMNKNTDKKFGARPIKRIIQNDIENKIAIEMLKREITEKDVLTVLEDSGEIIVKVS